MEIVFFGYVLVNMFVFYPAQEQMSDSEGEDGDDVDKRNLFDEPQIEQNLRQLDNDRQQITVTVEVHVHVDEVKHLIDNIVYSIHLSLFIRNWTDDSVFFFVFFAVFTRQQRVGGCSGMKGSAEIRCHSNNDKGPG